MDMPSKGSTTERGYGYTHQELRRTLLPYAYGQPCPRCGETMRPGQPLDLDHTEDRSAYTGMAHRSCNRRAGAHKRDRMRRAPRPQVTRDW